MPTFDPALIGTGLLDKYLFQGISVGGRVEVAKQVFVYSQLGTSNRTGDADIAEPDLWAHLQSPAVVGIAQTGTTRVNSSFGDGSYKSFSLSRNVNENLRMEVLLGQQDFASLFWPRAAVAILQQHARDNAGRALLHARRLHRESRRPQLHPMDVHHGLSLGLKAKHQ